MLANASRAEPNRCRLTPSTVRLDLARPGSTRLLAFDWHSIRFGFGFDCFLRSIQRTTDVVLGRVGDDRSRADGRHERGPYLARLRLILLLLERDLVVRAELGTDLGKWRHVLSRLATAYGR